MDKQDNLAQVVNDLSEKLKGLVDAANDVVIFWRTSDDLDLHTWVDDRIRFDEAISVLKDAIDESTG